MDEIEFMRREIMHTRQATLYIRLDKQNISFSIEFLDFSMRLIYDKILEKVL